MENKDLIIRTLLQQDEAFLMKCAVHLYHRQHEDEQASRETKHVNGLGFNKPDSPYLTEYAANILAENWAMVKSMSEQARERMLKYSKQLASILTDKEVTI